MLLRLLTRYTIRSLVKVVYWSCTIGFMFWSSRDVEEEKEEDVVGINKRAATFLLFFKFATALFIYFVLPSSALIGIIFGALLNPIAINRIFTGINYVLEMI